MGPNTQHRESKKKNVSLCEQTWLWFIHPKNCNLSTLNCSTIYLSILNRSDYTVTPAVPFHLWWVTLEPHNPFSSPPLTIPLSKAQCHLGGRLTVNLNTQREMSLNPKSCPGVSWFIGSRLYGVLCNTDELHEKKNDMGRGGGWGNHRWLIRLRVWLPDQVTLQHCHYKNTPASDFKSHSAIGNKVLDLANGQYLKDSWYCILIYACMHHLSGDGT